MEWQVVNPEKRAVWMEVMVASRMSKGLRLSVRPKGLVGSRGSWGLKAVVGVVERRRRRSRAALPRRARGLRREGSMMAFVDYTIMSGWDVVVVEVVFVNSDFRMPGEPRSETRSQRHDCLAPDRVSGAVVAATTEE